MTRKGTGAGRPAKPPKGQAPAFREEEQTLREGIYISDNPPPEWPKFGTINGHRVPLLRVERRLVRPWLVDDLRVVIGGVEQRPLRGAYETFETRIENGATIGTIGVRDLAAESAAFDERLPKGEPPVFLEPEPPPDDGEGYDPDRLPAHWPPTGRLRGHEVPLRGIAHRLSRHDLDELWVMLDGRAVRPFRA